MKALLILFLTALVVLFTGLTGRRDALKGLTLAGVLLALGATLIDVYSGDTSGWNTMYANMFVFDRYALAFSGVVLLTLALIIGLSGWSFRQLNETLGDHYGLMLFSACGALVMVSFTNLTMLFLGIEILSIPLYVLAGSRRRSMDS
ncbi:MAG: twin-arginine translocation signal domain-containing protein, partial [Saprospiraceae bacterium]